MFALAILWLGHILSWMHTGKRRYNIKLWKTFTDCFNCLPIAAIIDEKIFTMHGGLSPDLQSMEQIRRVMRPTDVPDTGKFAFKEFTSKNVFTYSLFLCQASFATFYGQILTRIFPDGQRMTGGYRLPLVPTLCHDFCKNMIWIWYVEHIKSLKMVMNSLLNDNWSPCFRHQITAENSTMQEQWWASTKRSCALSRWLSLATIIKRLVSHSYPF